jgi:regulator of sigma E protease
MVLTTIVSFIIVMSVLVFVHELGHLLVAKRSKIVVEEFGFGYPPRVKKLFERGGTIYSINAIPFGGFCRMRGEDDPSLAGSFASASKLARSLTLFAGPAMNLLLAVVLLTAMMFLIGAPDPTVTGAVIYDVVKDSPAAAAGLQPGDRIIAADETPIVTTDDLRVHSAAHLGQPVSYQFVRRDPVSGKAQTQQVTMTPRVNPPKDQGALGLKIGAPSRPATIGEAVKGGVSLTGQVVWYTFAIPARLIRTGRPIGEFGFTGPVGIAVLTGDAVQESQRNASAVPLLEFTALLSVALAITNLLPLPALDGGRLLFILIEVIRRRRIDPNQEGLVHLIGFGLLLLLVGAVTVREVSDLIRGLPVVPGLR